MTLEMYDRNTSNDNDRILFVEFTDDDFLDMSNDDAACDRRSLFARIDSEVL